MSKTRFVTLVSIIGIAAVVSLNLPLNFAKAGGGHGHHGKKDMKVSLEKIHSEHLVAVSKSIDKAIEALGAGNKESALSELHKAQKMLVVIKAGIGNYVKPKFANVSCPIMDSPINPDKVSKALVRDFKGQKIAFCCGGCPTAWDKLTDAEKSVKLAKVMPESTKDVSGHKH